VLVIDDHAFSRHIGMAALRSLNVHMIAEAENASEGLGAIHSFAPDLILVDWVMEGVDGITFVKSVRSNKSSNARFLPLIMVSAYAELWRVREARDAGCNEFVVKPFAARTLYAKIRTIVENPRPFVEAASGYFGPDRRRRNSPVKDERRGDRKARMALQQNDINKVLGQG
jgi:two-component system, chemotaxis family, chemotaxis protein CheY